MLESDPSPHEISNKPDDGSFHWTVFSFSSLEKGLDLCTKSPYSYTSRRVVAWKSETNDLRRANPAA
jgi:hypothetical protein